MFNLDCYCQRGINLTMFVIEVVVCSGVELNYIILRGVSHVLPTPFTDLGRNIRNTFQYYAYINALYILGLSLCPKIKFK